MSVVEVPRPPEVPGFPGPSRGDTLRLMWWAERGFLHGARKGRPWSRGYSAFLALMWWPALPVLLAGQWWALRRRSARYYFTPTHDAVLALVASPNGWHVSEHYTAEPGARRGRALREALVPLLLAEADRQAVTIHGTAATRSLARQYAAQLPGVVDVGRGFYRGRRLQRLPSPR